MPRGPEGFAHGFEDAQTKHVLKQVIAKVRALQSDLDDENFRPSMLNDLQQRVAWLLDVDTIEGEHATLSLDTEGEPFLEGEPVPYR
jgi:hypothetical protein